MRRPALHSLKVLARGAGALFLCAILPWLAGANDLPLNEATAKIQFLHYVAQYAVWPKEVLSSHDKQFVLGVLGENPFGDALENYFRGKSVKGRQFVIKYFKDVDEVKGCHMLFISSSEKTNFAAILGKLEDTSILTISDTDGFIQKEGMIFIYMTEKTEITSGLAWDINPQAMRRANLKIDPFFIEKARKPNRP